MIHNNRKNRFYQFQIADNLEINVMPLLDVILIILIFFIVNFSLEHSNYLNISLPYSTRVNSNLKTEDINLTITETGFYAINKDPPIDNNLNAIENKLIKLLANKDNSKISLNVFADANTNYQAIINIFDLAGKLGLKKIKLHTKKQNNSN